MIPIGEEATREETIVKSEEGNGSVAEKAPLLEEKAEDKQGKIKRHPIIFDFSTAGRNKFANKKMRGMIAGPKEIKYLHR